MPAELTPRTTEAGIRPQDRLTELEVEEAKEERLTRSKTLTSPSCRRRRRRRQATKCLRKRIINRLEQQHLSLQ
jgi:hypothetical protein